MNKKNDLTKGALANLSIAPSVMAYGSVLGVLASQKGISVFELMLMNFTVFAGSSMFVMAEMWQENLEILSMLVAVFVINLRYLLICASLNPLFKDVSLSQKMMIIHLVADENWAVTMNEQRKNPVSIWFLFGGGLCLLVVWSFGTIAGHQLGAIIGNPETLGLDFAFLAVFTAFTVNLWRGNEDLFPWLLAAVVAVVVEWIIPGKWYIFFGGVAGAVLAAFITKKEKIA